MVFEKHDTYTLADLLMDYDDGTSEYDSAIQMLLAARDSPLDIPDNVLRLILDAMEEYDRDTAERLTPSYESPPFSSPATADIVSAREAIFRLREEIRKTLTQRTPPQLEA